MSLTAPEMKQLAEDARTMAMGSRGFLSNALQCLRETADPIAPLALLHALGSGGHAKRDPQKAALDDVGQWLDHRLGREPGVAPERLALELGWLRRLVMIEGDTDGRDEGGRARPPPRSYGGYGRGRDEPGFGLHIEQLRKRRELALARTAAAPLASRPEPAVAAADAASRRPEHLPDSFEVRLDSWEQALDAFRTARKRRKEGKPVRDRLLALQPTRVELQHLTADLVCSLLETQGMEELQARAVEDAGKLPAFWIASAELVDRGGKRVARRISFMASSRPDI